MKKKIICIGIISMFLLTGVTVVSAVEIETITTSSSSTIDEIDIQLTVKNLEARYDHDTKEFTGYYCSVNIKNVGTKTLRKDQYGNFEVMYSAEHNGEEFMSRTFNTWKHHLIGDTLEPDEKIGWTLNFVNFDGDHAPAPPKSLLKISIDPNNLIPETDDDTNNNWECIGPDVKLVNRFFKGYLQFNWFNKISFLQTLLKRFSFLN